MDEHTISPAGDPFYAAGFPSRTDQDQVRHPHGCIAGVVYIGHLVEGEDGAWLEHGRGGMGMTRAEVAPFWPELVANLD